MMSMVTIRTGSVRIFVVRDGVVNMYCTFFFFLLPRNIDAKTKTIGFYGQGHRRTERIESTSQSRLA